MKKIFSPIFLLVLSVIIIGAIPTTSRAANLGDACVIKQIYCFRAPCPQPDNSCADGSICSRTSLSSGNSGICLAPRATTSPESATSTEAMRAQLRQLTELLKQLRIQIIQAILKNRLAQQQAAQNGQQAGNQGNQGGQAGQNQGGSPVGQASNNGSPVGQASPSNQGSPLGQGTPIPVNYGGSGESATSPQPYTGSAKGAVYCGPPRGSFKPGPYKFDLMTTFTRQEGETIGMSDNALSSWEQFKEGKVKCVSVATSMDLSVGYIPYGTRMRCPELNKKLNGGNEIVLVKVDVGHPRYFYGTSRLDFYTERNGAVDNIKNLECEVLPASEQVAPK